MNPSLSACQYPSDQSGKQFSEQGNLKVHVQSVHERVKYSCDQCGKKITHQGNLERHIHSVHERVKYPFDQCSKDTYAVWP